MSLHDEPRFAVRHFGLENRIMATINRKAGVLIAVASMAIAITGMSSPSFAQHAEDRGRGNGGRSERALPPPRENARADFGTQLRQMREQRQQPQAQRPAPQRQVQRPVVRGNDGPRPNWQGGQRPDRDQQASGNDRRPAPGWQRPDVDRGADRGGDRGAGQAIRRDNDRTPGWRADNDRHDNDRDRNPSWRADNERRDNDRWRGNEGWRGNNDGWRNNDRRDDNRGNDRWRDNNGNRYQAWNRNDWRRDNRYDWQRYRDRNRNNYRIGRYYAPYNGYSYRRLSIGFSLGSMFYGNRYWINDPWQYRLPPVYGPYRWVRYYDDVMLVDIYSGEVVDVIYDFFW